MEIKTETKLLRALSKIFNEHNEIRGNIELNKGYMDCANVCMIVPKTEEMAIILSRFFTPDKATNVPELNYNSKEESVCSYSMEYLTEILNCFKAVDESVKIYLIKDYPLKISGKSFDFILAPIVNND